MSKRELQYGEEKLDLDKMALDDLKPVVIALFKYLDLSVVKTTHYNYYTPIYEVTNEELVERDD